jgi:hypothetical protein
MRENAALCIVHVTSRGHVTHPYSCAIQCLPRNLATHCAERSEGKGGEARRGSAPLLLPNRVPRGFCASTFTAWSEYATIQILNLKQSLTWQLNC